MKKIIVILFLLIGFLVIGGCQKTEIHTWEFKYDSSQVDYVQLVRFDQGSAEEVVVEIEHSLIETMMNDLEALEMRQNGDAVVHHGMCIIIMFNSGEYDIISQNNPKHYVNDSGLLPGHAHATYLKCDKDAFKSLIQKYLNQ